MAIIDVIKYEGDNSVFIWKHPCTDFNTATQVIVHESQEAILFMNGQALDLFEAGRHTLETQNIPILNKIINLPTGKISPFHCEVYFINKTEHMAMSWGTNSKIQYLEPNYGFPISIGASGEMSLSVENARNLLIKLVGTETVLDRAGVNRFFRMFLLSKLKSYIAQTMRKKNISIFEVDERLNEFSDDIRELLVDDFLDYGINLERFFVTTIVKPDGDAQYERFKELHFRKYADVTEARIKQEVGVIDEETEAKRRVIDARSLAEKRNIEGYTYKEERGFDIAEKAAENEGVGEFTNMGIGLGVMGSVGSNVGGMVGGAIGGAFNGINGDKTEPDIGADRKKFCIQCGQALDIDDVFCDNCGTKSEEDDICKNCNYKFTKQGKFCPKCGARR